MREREGLIRAAARAGGRAIVALLCLLSASPAGAQHARVFVANSSNSRVLQVEFDPVSTSVVIDDANTLTQVRDISIRDDGLAGAHLIVCDRNGGRVVFYQSATGSGQVIFDRALTAGPERPDGLSLDASGNLFVMNSGQGSAGGVSQVWAIKRDTGCPDPQRPECVGGGYRTPLGLVDADVRIATQIAGNPALLKAGLLPESLVVPATGGAFGAGDLLVLTNPGAVIRYSGAEVQAFLAELASGQAPAPLIPDTVIHPPGSSVPQDQRFPDGAVPNGMARAPGGDLLITIDDGRILHYGPDGLRLPDFAPGSGQGEFKIAIGLQDGRTRAFVTHQQRGELRRYLLGGPGSGTLDTVVDGLQFPVGVDATTSATVAAPAGQNVDVAPTALLSSRIEQVVLAGLVNGTVSTFPDPREQEQVIPPGQPLHRSLFLNELRADFPPIEIPAWARAFRLNDPDTGVPTFIIVEARTNVALAGVVDHKTVESIILGYEPDCQDPDLTRQPFMFWAPDADDPPIVEGARFIDVTTGCGTIRGLTRDMSYFIAGVRITAPMKTVVAEKLDGLRRVIAGASCVDAKLRLKLGNLADRAIRDFGRARYASVAESLQSIDTLVEQAPNSFSTCSVNISGEIQARARSALFALAKVN